MTTLPSRAVSRGREYLVSRPHRLDIEGAYYHVGNRAIARRSYFEKRADFRFFKSRLAYAARRGEILVIAFALMTTHFHLLVQSLGGLSEALRRIQNEYTRRFNRLRKRDGALGRGRFFSERIKTLTHRKNTLHYIDDNPVLAKLSCTPEAYEWSSAYLYATEHRPLWLETEWVDSLGLPYGQDRAPQWTPEQRAWRADLIETRITHPGDLEDPSDDLCAGVPGRVWDWMVRKAELADGTRPGLPIAGPLLIVAVVEAFRLQGGGAGLALPGSRGRNATDLLLIGLLRDLAGQSWVEIAHRCARHPTSVRGGYKHHARLVREDPPYAAVAHELIGICLDALRV